LPGLPRASLADVGLAQEPFEALERRFHEVTKSGEVPGLAYAVLKDGKLVRAGSYGVTDLSSRQPWCFDTICRLYSMTKTVAICAFMSLVEEGLAALDDPLSKHLPDFELASRQQDQQQQPKRVVTLRHLVAHTSGLSYGPPLGDTPSCPAEESYCPLIGHVDSGEVADLASWCRELSSLPTHFEPGERWEYSYATDVLGRVMEVVSGKRLDDLLHERIMAPLGLRDTAFAISQAAQSRLASLYRRNGQGDESGEAARDALNCVDGGEQSFWVEPRQQTVLSAGGMIGTVSGGLVSTLNDFARLCLMLQRGGELDGVRILRPETVAWMCDNLLPEMTGRPDSWCLETPGLGFGALGSVAVEHPEANWYDVPGEVGWGGLAGTAWAVDRRDGLVVVSFCQVVYELWIDEEVRKATRAAQGYAPPSPSAVSGEASDPVEAAAEEEAKRPIPGGDEGAAAEVEAEMPAAKRPCLGAPSAAIAESITPFGRVAHGPQVVGA